MIALNCRELLMLFSQGLCLPIQGATQALGCHSPKLSAALHLLATQLQRGPEGQALRLGFPEARQGLPPMLRITEQRAKTPEQGPQGSAAVQLSDLLLRGGGLTELTSLVP